MSLKIIKNGTIVTAAETYSAEILINGEVIEAIGRDFERLHPEAEVIDAAGKYVFPAESIRMCIWICRCPGRFQATITIPGRRRRRSAGRRR